MITEMERGFSGHCPYTDLADVFASVLTCGTPEKNEKPSTCSEEFRRSPVLLRSAPKTS
jgi:hypothetical protein